MSQFTVRCESKRARTRSYLLVPIRATYCAFFHFLLLPSVLNHRDVRVAFRRVFLGIILCLCVVAEFRRFLLLRLGDIELRRAASSPLAYITPPESLVCCVVLCFVCNFWHMHTLKQHPIIVRHLQCSSVGGFGRTSSPSSWRFESQNRSEYSAHSGFDRCRFPVRTFPRLIHRDERIISG